MVYYQSSMGDFGIFIYNLLWWIVIINISVALMNMLPLGIFDGGKFFYLSVLAITRSKKASEIAYKFSTWFFIILLAAMMIKWFLIFI
jgi:membrane-associated protease RseP (regulator of RpoE activity)